MIDLDHITFVGAGLERPECVLCTASGHLHASHWGGGVSILDAGGNKQDRLATGLELKPNGIGLLSDGSYLLAHLGATDGGIYRLRPDGTTKPLLLEVDGAPLPPTNYVHCDTQNRLWVSVSTRLQPRNLGYRADVADGFIVLIDEHGPRIVADGLGYTNECVVHPDGQHLFVNETFARRLSSFYINADGSLSHKTTIAEFGAGTFPDGLTFDAEGGIWITSIVSNRVIRIAPSGEQTLVIEDSNPEHLAWVERAFLNGTMGRPHLDQVPSRRLRNISSLAFGGADLRTVYLGCLLGDAIATFRSPIPGFPPPHWTVRGFLESPSP